jgi:hypothetical protein
VALFVVEFQPWEHHHPRVAPERLGYLFWNTGAHVIAGAYYYIESWQLEREARKYGLTVSHTPPAAVQGDVFDVAAADLSRLMPYAPFGRVVLFPSLLGGVFVATAVWLAAWCLAPIASSKSAPRIGANG